jgi:dihydroxy-acid dehydratase
MPEEEMIPIPRKLAEEGVVDILRISDGRVSGTVGRMTILYIPAEAA